MKKPSVGPGSYVRKVQEDTQRYVRELLAENDRLRALVAALENERIRLAERGQSVDDLLTGLDESRARVSSLEQEKQHLEDQLLAARQELEIHAGEREQPERQIQDVKKDGRRITGRRR
jgi:hypothetical protein